MTLKVHAQDRYAPNGTAGAGTQRARSILLTRQNLPLPAKDDWLESHREATHA